MEVHTFIADSAPDAVAQIRGTLGPEAVVLNVRKLDSPGLARFWTRSRIEVLACLPENRDAAVFEAPENALAEIKKDVADLKEKVRTPASSENLFHNPKPLHYEFGSGRMNERMSLSVRSAGCAKAGWGIGGLLESGGLLPVHVERVLEELKTRHGDGPPPDLAAQIQMASAVLSGWWRPSKTGRATAHVFVGAPGSGKTTCLCKWMAGATLVQNLPSRVWRLDGRNANTAELLGIYAEILGAPLERVPSSEFSPDDEILFVDLPGVNWTDPAAIEDLAGQVSRLPAAEVHLVLNAAYEMPALLAQVRAFSVLPIESLIFTHLDEERRWGKLWNFVLGTNYSVSYLSAGQNIPGEFQAASAQALLSRQFARK